MTISGPFLDFAGVPTAFLAGSTVSLVLACYALAAAVLLLADRWEGRARRAALCGGVLTFAGGTAALAAGLASLDVGSKEIGPALAAILALIGAGLLAGLWWRVAWRRRGVHADAPAIRALRRSEQIRTQVIAAACHDLGQPFQALRLSLDLMDARLSDAGMRPALGVALEALATGEAILRSLTELASVRAGTIPVRRERFALALVTQRIEAHWRDAAQAKGVRFQVMHTWRCVNSDPELILRILDNLLANAVRYTVSGRILVGCRMAAGGVRVEVWDTGPGIPVDAQGEIFEDFVQLSNPERSHAKGLGVGLAVARGLAHFLGGEISVSSVPGRGSVFRLFIQDGFVVLPK
jgi:signal transduction histidine kinase